MTQKITFSIKPDQNVPELPKIPTKHLVIACVFIAVALVTGVLNYRESNNIGHLRVGGALACIFLSMLVIGLFSRFKRAYRCEAHMTSEGVEFRQKVGALVLAAIISIIGTVLLVHPGNIEQFHVAGIILMGLASLLWSGFTAVAALTGSQSYTLVCETGIKIHTPFQGDRTVWWDDCPEPHLIKPQIVALTIDGKDIHASAGREGVDPRIMAAFINYYRTHPEHRHELATGEAVERLRAGHLPIDWTIAPVSS